MSEVSVMPYEGGRREKHRILLVEDARELGEALTQQFEVLGYECAIAQSCDAARQNLSRTSYAAALIDLGLPDGRGLDLLGYLTKSAPQTVPIILTGDAASETIIQATIARTGIAAAATRRESLSDK